MSKNLFGLLLLMLFCSDMRASEWRGIIPLKSTRSDVERLLGQPNQLGRYEIENERAIIWYSEGPCEDRHQALKKGNCECLVAKDIVLKISVTLDSAVKLAKLGIQKRKYERTAVDSAYPPTATYSDFKAGIVYTVLESEEAVTHISYLPSRNDCSALISSQAHAAPVNAWRGIVPLRSTRGDVEKLLGPPRTSIGEIFTYETPENKVDVSYSSNPCKVEEKNPSVSNADRVFKVSVSSRRVLLVRGLQFDRKKFKRIKNDHPENWVHYLNSKDGITIDAILNNGSEEVLSVIYRGTPEQRELLCGPERRNKKL